MGEPCRLDDLAAALADAGLRVERDAPSAAFTTYRCGGPFRLLVRLGSVTDARIAATVLASHAHHIPVLVVGRGSNLLVADRGFDGLALVLDRQFEEIEFRAGDVVDAGGAVPLPVLARQAAAAGVGGLEFFVGIPGTVGGAVRMNAGGHGRDTAEVLISARCLDLAAGVLSDQTPEQLALGYRRSNIGSSTVVCAATFAGTADEPDHCNARIAEIVQWRRAHQPGGSNAGSVFTNPPGDAAGRLIDACGLKGTAVGGVVVSEKHANFFVAGDGATATDVHDLIELVRRRVADQTGVELVTELRLIGFDQEDAR